MIEDLSVDPELEKHEKADKKENSDEHTAGLMNNLFEDDSDKPDDYTIEETTSDGHKLKKHVHKGPGFKEVHIESDSPLKMDEIMK